MLRKGPAVFSERCQICDDTKLEYVALYECDHAPTCLECAAYLRKHEKTVNCPECGKGSARVIYMKKQPKFLKYNYDEWIEPFGPKIIKNPLEFDEGYAGHFTDISIIQRLRKVDSWFCPLCKKKSNQVHGPYRTRYEAVNHVETSHYMFYCNICLDEAKRFFAHQQLFTKQELKLHMDNFHS
eukprot:GHVO01045437.1.p1 GENE.GHVO01045437.1~~GHVO01045437.1.p1  ORF type:complete len:183 (-),score=10.65 GHVO01045437.1:143-691(-)